MDNWTDMCLQHQEPCRVCGDVQYWTNAQDKRGEGPWCIQCGRIICVACDCICGKESGTDKR